MIIIEVMIIITIITMMEFIIRIFIIMITVGNDF